jgi:hypothetical protein
MQLKIVLLGVWLFTLAFGYAPNSKVLDRGKLSVNASITDMQPLRCYDDLLFAQQPEPQEPVV